MTTHYLSESQIAHYCREGYVVVPSIFDHHDLKRLDEFIRVFTQEALVSGDYSKVMELEPELIDGEQVARRIYNPFEQHDMFREVATDPRILDRIESLIGPDIGLQHSKLNMKPARVGSVVEWHQDLAYLPHTNDDLVTTLIYLDDATVENGCLQVIPRHHRQYFDHTGPDGEFSGMITEDMGSGRFGRPQSLPAPAGSVILMHCILPHSSLPNRSDKPRRTLIFGYWAADALPIYYSEIVESSELTTHHHRGKQARSPHSYLERVLQVTLSIAGRDQGHGEGPVSRSALPWQTV